MMNKLLNTAEAAKIIGVSSRQVRNYARDGLIIHRRVSGVITITERVARAFKRPSPGPRGPHKKK